MRHVGVKPSYPIEVLDFKRKIYIEELPDGTYNLWTKKMLNSGCDKVLKGKPKEMRGCIYCPWCDEWFSRSQWDESSRDTTKD